jgi:hypothetical protein
MSQVLAMAGMLSVPQERHCMRDLIKISARSKGRATEHPLKSTFHGVVGSITSTADDHD